MTAASKRMGGLLAVVGLGLALVLTFYTGAAPADGSAERDARLTEQVRKLIPEAEDPVIRSTPVEGILEVVVDEEVLYITEGGRYIFAGDLLDVEERRNLSEAARGRGRAEQVARLDDEGLITYPAEDERHRVTVFTDIDCPYCQRLHEQIEAYNERGITVQYAAFPRAGRGSGSWDKAVAVWCADDRQAAMDRAMKNSSDGGGEACDDHPVGGQFDLAGELGIRGTPTIVAESGRMIPGFAPPEKLVEALEQ
ncbi:thiol:disulfide interchange protein DsbC [Thiohalospira halophila DSM 15071]|uniref:Thiol:disulfide interchange protein n=1 Tax=Thiohalospira halophila DSM 15071 TaxID=1123397 RepID=A0A1I1QJD5_9GAMM|nr:DsbC family protein [Thiohalospira halophila]SFD22231.1 thiol:disulfide interchange protein DsbC [Thiohalospira halophila DSM 15071]